MAATEHGIVNRSQSWNPLDQYRSCAVSQLVCVAVVCEQSLSYAL